MKTTKKFKVDWTVKMDDDGKPGYLMAETPPMKLPYYLTIDEIGKVFKKVLSRRGDEGMFRFRLAICEGSQVRAEEFFASAAEAKKFVVEKFLPRLSAHNVVDKRTLEKETRSWSWISWN